MQYSTTVGAPFSPVLFFSSPSSFPRHIYVKNRIVFFNAADANALAHLVAPPRPVLSPVPAPI